MTEANPRGSGNHAPKPNAPAAPADPGQEFDDPRARAAARAAVLRERGSMDEGEDKFYINPADIPDGWSYEWKRFELLGKPDPSYQVNLARRGWEAVPLKRHRNWMPDNYHGDTITRDGMILMERPQEITDESSQQDIRRAREQVRAKEEQLGAAPIGAFESNNKGKPLATIKKSVEVGIPDK